MSQPDELLEKIRLLPQTHETIIPDDYLDAMGHMNVMWYTHLFGRGMGGVFQRIGLDRSYMESNNAGSFLLESHVRYLAEVRVGQKVVIHSRLIGRTTKRFHAVQFMINCDREKLAATSEYVGTHVDLNSRRSSPLPDFVGAKLDDLVNDHTQLDWDPPLCGSMGP